MGIFIAVEYVREKRSTSDGLQRGVFALKGTPADEDGRYSEHCGVKA